MRLLFDIEANDLLDKVTTVHTIVVEDLDTGERTSYADQPGYRPIIAGLRHLNQATLLVGHNIMGYDIPALRKVYPKWNPTAAIRDTLILSRLIWPDISRNDHKLRDFPQSQVGKHSLYAWGWRLGEKKGQQPESFERWSPEMQTYCEQDVSVNRRLWDKIVSRNYSEVAIQGEHEFAEIMRMQEAHGFPFDRERAKALTAVLIARRAELLPLIQAAFKPRQVVTKTPAYWTIGGVAETFPTKTAAVEYAKKQGWRISLLVITPGPMRVKSIPFCPTCREQIAERLVEQGWRPTRFTPTGKPKTDDEALEEAFATLQTPEIKLLGEYLMVQKRISQVAEGDEGWLRLVGADGRMHGGVITNGTVTGRCSHVHPNMAQVPALKDRRGKTQPYGRECRELFCALPGWVLLGLDASGLELRCLAHFLARYDGGEYVKAVTTGDVHTMNQQAAGLDSRAKAKTFIYAYIYGASDWKLGFTAELLPGEVATMKADHRPLWMKAVKTLAKQKRSTDDETVAYTVKGAILRDQFETKLPAIKQLRAAMNARITEPTPSGFLRLKDDASIKGIDGRIVPIRSKHSALNALLQGAGGLLVKKATVILYRKLLAKGWRWGEDFAFVAHIHDELQIMVRPHLAEALGQAGLEAIKEAGEFFNFRCPLTGEYKVGPDWSVTH